MENMKFDIKKMTDEFNAVDQVAIDIIDRYDDSALVNLTTEQMSEMVQKHAFKLGYAFHVEPNFREIQTLSVPYLMVHNSNKNITRTNDGNIFKAHSNQETGLEFFSIKPEPKRVLVEMDEEVWLNVKHNRDTLAIEMPCSILKNWRLVK